MVESGRLDGAVAGESRAAPVRSLAITPDGLTVVSDGVVTKQTGITQKKIPFFPTVRTHSTPLQNLSDSLLLWDAATGQGKPGLPGPLTMAPPEQVALSRDGRILAAGGKDGSAWLWDLQQPQQPRRLFVSKAAEAHCQGFEFARMVSPVEPTYPEPLRALDLSPDGQVLAIASTVGNVTLWDVAGGKLLHTLSEPQIDVQWLRFSPDGQTLACNAGGQVRLWDVQTARLTRAFGNVADSRSLCGTFSADGRLLVSGTNEQAIRTWELKSGQEQTLLAGHAGPVSAVAFAPDGKTLASGSWDHTVRLWNVAAWREVAALEGHRGKVTCLAFAGKGSALVSGSDAVPGELICWRTARDPIGK